MNPQSYLDRLALMSNTLGDPRPTEIEDAYATCKSAIENCNTTATATGHSPEKVCNDALVQLQKKIIAALVPEHAADKNIAKKKLTQIEWALSCKTRRPVQSGIKVGERVFIRRSTPINYLSKDQCQEWLNILKPDTQPQWFKDLDQTTQGILKERLEKLDARVRNLTAETLDDNAQQQIANAVGHLSCTHRGVPGVANCWKEEMFELRGGTEVLLQNSTRIRMGTLDPYDAKDPARTRLLEQNFRAIAEICQAQGLSQTGQKVAVQTLVGHVADEGGMVDNMRAFRDANVDNFVLTETGVSNGILDKKRTNLAHDGITAASDADVQKPATIALLKMQGCESNGTPQVLRDDFEYAYAAALQGRAQREASNADCGGCKSGKDREGAKAVFAAAIEVYLAVYPNNDLPPPPSLTGGTPSPQWVDLEDIAASLLASGHDYIIAAKNSAGCHGIKDAERLFGESIYNKAAEIRRKHLASQQPITDPPQRDPAAGALGMLNKPKQDGEKPGGGFLEKIANFVRAIRFPIVAISEMIKSIGNCISKSDTKAATPTRPNI